MPYGSRSMISKILEEYKNKKKSKELVFKTNCGSYLYHGMYSGLFKYLLSEVVSTELLQELSTLYFDIEFEAALNKLISQTYPSPGWYRNPYMSTELSRKFSQAIISTDTQLCKILKHANKNTKGKRCALLARVRTLYKEQIASTAGLCKIESHFKYALVIDFEATCSGKDLFLHEIIEFPIVVVDLKSRLIVDSVRYYVRPVHNPTLTKFCKDLTGIEQKTVDRASVFENVLSNLEHWLVNRGYITCDITSMHLSGTCCCFKNTSSSPQNLPSDNQHSDSHIHYPSNESFSTSVGVSSASIPVTDDVSLNSFRNAQKKREKMISFVATDGSYDIAMFLRMQCAVSGLPFPPWAQRWLNVKRLFFSTYQLKHCTLSEMLDTLEIPLEGSLHSGLDDAKNIAAVLCQLSEDVLLIHPNEQLHLSADLMGQMKKKMASLYKVEISDCDYNLEELCVLLRKAPV